MGNEHMYWPRNHLILQEWGGGGGPVRAVQMSGTRLSHGNYVHYGL